MITYRYEDSVITYHEKQNTWYYTNGTTRMIYFPSIGFKIQKEDYTMEAIPLLTDMTEDVLFQKAMLYDAYALKWAQGEIHKLRIEYENNSRA